MIEPANASLLLPTESEHFKVRYRLWIGIALLLIGIICTLLNLWLLLLGELNGAIVVGVLVTIAGYCYLTRPYFVIAPHRLTIYNPIGQVVKRYPLAAFNDILVSDRTVHIKSNGPEKLKLNKWLVRPADWARLEAISRD
jgi:hypothetical protein